MNTLTVLLGGSPPVAAAAYYCYCYFTESGPRLTALFRSQTRLTIICGVEPNCQRLTWWVVHAVIGASKPSACATRQQPCRDRHPGLSCCGRESGARLLLSAVRAPFTVCQPAAVVHCCYLQHPRYIQFGSLVTGLSHVTLQLAMCISFECCTAARPAAHRPKE